MNITTMIENGIPIPLKRGTMGKIIKSMKRGQSFRVPEDNYRIAAITAARRMGIKTTSQKLNGGWRIWRMS